MLLVGRLSCSFSRSRLIPSLSHFQCMYHKHVNYYDLLGVKRHASEKEIKFAYFKMAKRYHPDTNKTLDARQMFDMIAEAYEVLSDDKRRQEYDETGQNSDRFGGRAEGPGRQSSDATYTAEQMYSRIFGSTEGKNLHIRYLRYSYLTPGSRICIFFRTWVPEVCLILIMNLVSRFDFKFMKIIFSSVTTVFELV
jgi:DnaJ domain